MVIITENKKIQNAYFFILVSMLFLRDIIGINLNKFIILLVCCFFMFIANYKDLTYMLLFTFPFLCGIPGTYIIFFSLIMYIIKYNKVNYYVAIFICYIFSMELFFSILYSEYNISLIVQYISYLSVMLFLIYSDLNINYEKSIKIFILGLFFVSLIIVLKTLIEAPTNWLYLFSKGWYRFGDTYNNSNLMVISLNANNLAYFCINGIFLSIILLEKGNKRNVSLYINLLIIFYFIVVGLLTQSRTFLLVLFLLLFIYLFIYLTSKIRKIKIFIFTTLLLIIFLYYFFILLKNHPEILEGIITRLTDSTMKTGGGRKEITIETFNYWSNSTLNVILGIGVVGYNNVLGHLGKIHNGILQILYSYGVIGFFAFLFILLKPVLILFRCKSKFVYFLPLLSIFIFMQTIQFLDPCFLMFPFVMGVFSVRIGKKYI